MKNIKTISLSFLLAIILCAGSQLPAFAAPIFSPKDDEPIGKSAEKIGGAVAEATQPTSTATANLHKDTAYNLAEIKVKILSGVNRAGEKSYSSTYQLAEASSEKSSDVKEPKVTVSFKNKLDKGKFTVSEIVVKKLVNNAYKITAKIVDLKSGEMPKDPKVTWLD